MHPARSIQEKCFVAVAGNIGAGKSTLTAMLARRMGWQPFFEANEDNPYLHDFYRDMQRWSFHSQVFFLGKRLEHHRQLLNAPGSVIQDRTVYEDAEVFARNLGNSGAMQRRDYEAYLRLYQSIRAFVPPPDLIVYLRTSPEKLMQHIRRRGRASEQEIGMEYLQQLDVLYEQWIAGWTHSPVLMVDNDSIDFETHADEFETIVAHIGRKLTSSSGHTVLASHD